MPLVYLAIGIQQGTNRNACPWGAMGQMWFLLRMCLLELTFKSLYVCRASRLFLCPQQPLYLDQCGKEETRLYILKKCRMVTFRAVQTAFHLWMHCKKIQCILVYFYFCFSGTKDWTQNLHTELHHHPTLLIWTSDFFETRKLLSIPSIDLWPQGTQNCV